MSDSQIEVHGGIPLKGAVKVSGAKNGVLPMLFISLLTSEKCTLSNVPSLHDVYVTSELLRHFGAEVHANSSSVLDITVPRLIASEASYSVVRSLRASFWLLGPLLARGGAARVSMPGGDVIGARPVDIHLDALAKMGADIRVKGGVVAASALSGLRPAEIDFHFPSVGATHQILMAASLTPGTTVIRNAACEPEVIAVGECLQEMGAGIEGLGTGEIVIKGRSELGGFNQQVLGDRIEAATFICAAAATGGEVSVSGFNPRHLGATYSFLEAMGIKLSLSDDRRTLTASLGSSGIQAVDLTTGPFPEVATDHQALLVATLCLARGESNVRETVYEGRFGHIAELCRMGAHIQLHCGQTAKITGVEELYGATVEARDIRAGAAMVIAGLAASGRTVIEESHHLQRGYEKLEQKFRSLGAQISSIHHDEDDHHVVGC